MSGNKRMHEASDEDEVSDEEGQDNAAIFVSWNVVNVQSFIEKLQWFRKPYITPFVIPYPLNADELCSAIIESWRDLVNATLGQEYLPKIGNCIVLNNNVQYNLLLQAVIMHNSHNFYQDVDKIPIPGQAEQTSFPLGEIFVSGAGTLNLFDRIVMLENDIFPSIPFK